MKLLSEMTEPELSDVMRACARGVTSLCEAMQIEKPMFALLLFNDPAVAQYICNCNRQDTIKAMRECADRLQRKEDVSRE